MKTRQELKTEILSHLTIGTNWGKACNAIQDVAAKHLGDKAWNKAAVKMNKDYKECEGSDFLLMNGQYWDWKEFKSAAPTIVAVYLDYFTDADLEVIAKNM